MKSMKRALCVLLASVLAAGMLSGCNGGGQTQDGGETPEAGGTYSAAAPGMGGNVTVTITTDGEKITKVDIDGPDETPDIGGKAIEQLGPAILEAQSADVDAISGATVTSTAVKTAAADAIAQAFGGGETAAEGLAFTAGTYTATAQGYNGPVELSVTFEADKIADIVVSASEETEHVGTPAFDLLIPQIVAANGTGVDAVSGATFTSRAIKEAVNDAAEQAGVTNKTEFITNTVEVTPGEAMDLSYDVVIVGGGGAGIAAAAQAAEDGNTVLLIEKNAEVGGNTLVSGGQYQSVMPYLVWDPDDPDATTGVGFDGVTYDKVKSVQGCIDELKMIRDWDEKEFDADYYVENEYVAGDAKELSKHGVHADYLPTLVALKEEIKEYLDWAQPKLDAGTPEDQLTLFSTLNLHIFQTYYGGLRQSADKTQWIYGDVDLVKQFIEDGQDLNPWLEAMGSTFIEDSQQTLIGALWYRENEFIGANVDTDGDGETEEYGGRWGTYFVAPMTAFLNANEANQILTRTTATDLIVEDGRVTGVKAVQYDGTEVTAHAAKGVILATGGFAANINKVLENNIYWSEEYLSTATKTTNRNSMQGDGIDMAVAAGADTVGLGFTQLMPISWVDNGNLAFGGGNYACWINPTTGHRFVDEGSERDVLSLAEFRNGIEVNGTKGVFLEFYNSAQPMPAPKQLADGDYPGRYYRRTIAELPALFEELGIEADPEVVIQTIRDYDNAVMTGGEFPDVGKAIASRPVGDVERNEDGTYNVDSYNLDDTVMTIRMMAPSTHHTMGGVRVDVDRHVLDADGNPVPGLYAAGEVTGGIHGGNRLGGNAIVEIFVSGRTAAKAVTADNAGV
ncbi:MAG: FAD-dependent oxidoreductase [Oscillibacter sp.]|nr:FAD-dependent oxidoreductase [Oscillibacter sp.]